MNESADLRRDITEGDIARGFAQKHMVLFTWPVTHPDTCDGMIIPKFMKNGRDILLGIGSNKASNR